VKTGSLLLLTLAACAGVRAPDKGERLRDLLENHHFEATCDKVWPDALRVAADAGYGLAAEDRQLAGLPAADAPPQGAVATHAAGGGRREADTGPGKDGRRVRLQGDDDAVGCHVAYLAAPAADAAPGEADTALELALVRKLDAPGARAIEAQAQRPPPTRRVGDSARSRY
jgi:hypothetical protein